MTLKKYLQHQRYWIPSSNLVTDTDLSSGGKNSTTEPPKPFDIIWIPVNSIVPRFFFHREH